MPQFNKIFAGTQQSRRRKRSPAPVQDSGLGSAVALLSTGATSLAIKAILMMMILQLMLLMLTMMMVSSRPDLPFLSLGESFGESLGERPDGAEGGAAAG